MIVCYSHIDSFSPRFFSLALNVIPQKKAQDIKRIGHIISRNESTLGWALTAFAARQLGFSLKNSQLEFTESGKPYLKDSAFHFGISHSGGFVCCAVADKNVGIDVQKIISVNDRVAKRVLSMGELSILGASQNSAGLFAKLWSMKEAYIKYTGQGINTSLSSIDFSSVCQDDRFIFEGLNFIYSDFGEYKMTVCSEQTDIKLIEINEADLNTVLRLQ